MIDIEKFISTIRDSFIGSQQVYTEGSCYQFYLILKNVFPDAICWYDECHIITEIDGRFYDITGEVQKNSNLLIMDHAAHYSLKKPFNMYLGYPQYNK